NLFQVRATGISTDGNIWIYNESNAKLLKINEQLQKISESNDLRQETKTVPQIQSLLEEDGVVYLCDTVNGLYTFNRFSAFLNIIPFKGILKIQVIDDQVVFLKNKHLFVYNKQTFLEREIELPLKD